MSENTRKYKEKISISIGNTNLSNINKAIDNGEFSSVSEVIDKGMSFFFENRNKPSSKDEFKQWLLSKEGEVWIKDIIRQVMKE